MKILGIKIDKITKKEALEKVGEFLNSDKQHKIFTPNPEMLVDTIKDGYFKEILNSGDLNICDGFGLWLAVRLSSRAKRSGADRVSPKALAVVQGSLSKTKTERIAGVDFMLDICQLAENQSKSIYLLGSNSDDVVKKTAEVLQEKFPMLKIVGYNKGPKLTNSQTHKLEYNKDKNEDVLYDIITTSPDILFVAFGHGKQEKWIEENLIDLPSVKVAMGVGGSFDFISGQTKRAPKWMRVVGLEWLYRLVREPKRLKRIWKAVITFLFLILFNRHTDLTDLTN